MSLSAGVLISRRVALCLPWLVFAGAVLVLSVAAASREPWRTDEHRYIEIAREMVSTGSWLVPHLNGVLYADKPPGFFATVAAAYQGGVPLGLAGMLPSVVGTGVMLALSFALARRAFGQATAWTTVTILASVELFASLAVRVNLDALLAASVTAAMYAVWRALEPGSSGKSAAARWLFAAGLATGLGVLIKGPVAIVFPAATLVALASQAWARARLSGSVWVWAALGLAAPVSVWVGLAALAAGPSYVGDLVWGHGVGHALGQVDKVRPWWFYLKDYPGSLLPWSLVLPALLVWLRLGPKDRGTLFALAWLGASFVVMSLFPAKRHLYLLPLCPAAAMLFARLVHTSRPDATAFRISWDVGRYLLGIVAGFLGVGLISTSVLVVLGVDDVLIGLWPAWEFLRGEIVGGTVPGFGLGGGGILLIGGWWLIDSGHDWREIAGIRAVGLGTALFMVGVLHPIDAIGRSPGGFYRRVEALVGNDTLGFYGSSDFAPNWLLKRDEVSMLPDASYLRTYLETNAAPEWLIAEAKSLARFGMPDGAERVFSVRRVFEAPMVLLRSGSPHEQKSWASKVEAPAAQRQGFRQAEVTHPFARSEKIWRSALHD